MQTGGVIQQFFFEQAVEHGAYARLLAAALHVQARRQSDGMPGKLRRRDDGGYLTGATRGWQQRQRRQTIAGGALAVIADDVVILRACSSVLCRQLN